MSKPNNNHEYARKYAIGMLAGAGSGILNKTCIAPLERIKILYQVQGMRSDVPLKYGSLFQTFQTIVKEEGALALWKGNGTNCLRIVPNYACKFTFNDVFKDLVRGQQGPGPKRPLDFYEMMLAGTGAGLVQVVITYPLELVRTRLSLAEALSRGVKYNGIIDCFRRTVRNEGFPGLYKGIGPTIVSGAPYTGLQMSTYETFKRLFPLDANGKQGTLTSLAAGALSGIVSQTITYPGDTIRRRMQANGLEGMPRTYLNSMDCLKKILALEGPLALFSGCRANVYRAVPGTAIQFWSYEAIKKLFGIEPVSGG